jgi:hypothetical protein
MIVLERKEEYVVEPADAIVGTIYSPLVALIDP